MLTEKEAKTKWCPFGLAPFYARDVDLSGVVAANRASQSFEDDVVGIPNRPLSACACIASDCMAWRKHDQIGIGPNGEKRDRDLDGRTRWVDRGYCGLAGQPPAPRF